MNSFLFVSWNTTQLKSADSPRKPLPGGKDANSDGQPVRVLMIQTCFLIPFKHMSIEPFFTKSVFLFSISYD